MRIITYTSDLDTVRIEYLRTANEPKETDQGMIATETGNAILNRLLGPAPGCSGILKALGEIADCKRIRESAFGIRADSEQLL